MIFIALGKGAWRDNVFVERLWKSGQLRGSLPPRLRHGVRGSRLDRPIPDFLQYPQTPFEP